MGSLGGGEILLIVVLALLLFGPRNLPKIGKTIGRGLAEFRKASNELRSSLEREVEMEELRGIKEDLNSVRRTVKDPLAEARRLDREDEPAGRQTAEGGDRPAPASPDGDEEQKS